jgi:hypothetical protein
MSTQALGFIFFEDKTFDEHELDNISFRIVDLAVQQRIGIKIGLNVHIDSEQAYASNKSMLFEITDNPRTDFAEVLFLGQGVSLEIMGKSIDTSEDLGSRIARVQNFLGGIFNLGCVERIIFQLLGQIGPESSHTIKWSGFKQKMLDIYAISNNYTPSVRFFIY